MTRNEEVENGRRFASAGTSRRVLEPFAHQVSGRAHMLTFNPNTLCKSLSQREWNFYNIVPPSLAKFTPSLKGLLFVHLEKGNYNSHRFTSSDVWVPCQGTSNGTKTCGCGGVNEAKSEMRTSPLCTQPLSNDQSQNTCWHKVFEHTLFKGLERVQYHATDGFTSHAWTIDKDQEAVTEALGKNPWALRQHKREINRTLKGDVLRKEVDLPSLCREVGLQKEPFDTLDNDRHTKAYLLLGDVTANYKFPSILDLKIGTQLDRPGCSKAKRDKHYNLVQRSSTGSLGLRIAGMQVYQVKTGQYLCRDKYYGRGLSTKGFTDGLGQFLHNGERMLVEVIPSVVHRLMELRSEIEKQETFRFHASSVLILYEGGDDSEKKGQTIQNDTDQSTLDSNVSDCSNTTSGFSLRQSSVHIIDFAHSTFNGFLEDETTYEGPDKDCLHALDNLAAVLNNIYKNALCNKDAYRVC